MPPRTQLKSKSSQYRRRGRLRREPLPVLPAPAPDRVLLAGQMAIAATIVAWAVFVVLTIAGEGGASGSLGFAGIGYLVIMSLLTCSALAYLTTRQGYYSRIRRHRRATRAELAQTLESHPPTLTALVPSYQEDERVIRMTLLSAALQEYPGLRVVLLVDDPPKPRYAGPARLLEAARRVPQEIDELLAGPYQRFDAALADLELRLAEDPDVTVADLRAVAAEYDFAVRWLHAYADAYEIVDHADEFLVDHVIRGLAGDLESHVRALRAADVDGATLSDDHLRYLLRRLTWIFGAHVTHFQRKRYVSLSHESNKAMNLNSYIGLMGGRYREISVPGGGTALLRSDDEYDLDIPASDYVLTLDADSLLLPEYCLRIVHALEQAEYASVAVAQTPYTAFPGAGSPLERIAGATTDLQHIAHQGLTQYDATFWVGANAILRKTALDDLREVSHDGDWTIVRYISDRTVIEDTESSIDLGIHGWRLLNYPERLSYSATPGDFGALCIQRQRWANGGLLILPRLWQQIRTRRMRGEHQRIGETVLRINYMASIAWASVGLILLLTYQFDDRVVSPFALLIPIPYFVMMAADLRHCGYKGRDVFRIYGFNLILLAVNLAGIGASLLQLMIGGRPTFKRTPKVRSRTTAGLTFVVVPYLFVAFSVLTLISDLHRDRWVNAGMAIVNGVLAAYAIVAYIGIGNSLVDIWTNVLSWLRRPAHHGQGRHATRGGGVPIPSADTAHGHWSQTLDYAPPHGVRRAERRVARTAGPIEGERRGLRAGRRGSDDEGSAIGLLGPGEAS